MAKFVGAACGSIFAALFPSECRICRVPLANISRLPVCDECLAKIIPITGMRCQVCGDLLPPASLLFKNETICVACEQEPPAFACATSYGAYLGELRELIHLLRYRQVRSAAAVLGRLLVEAAEPLLASAEIAKGRTEPLMVLPVPLHAAKFRERGFNQAELIARSALRELERTGGRKLEFDTTILLRRRATESQVGMSREQRRENIRGAFTVAKEQVAGREVLLIDDVMTTGATVSECARVLRSAGTKSIWVVTVARSKKESSWVSSYPEEAAGVARLTQAPADEAPANAMIAVAGVE